MSHKSRLSRIFSSISQFSTKLSILGLIFKLGYAAIIFTETQTAPQCVEASKTLINPIRLHQTPIGLHQTPIGLHQTPIGLN